MQMINLAESYIKQKHVSNNFTNVQYGSIFK